MPLPFATAVARSNASLLRCLGNAQAQVAGGVPATVIFEERYISPLGIEAAQPSVTGLSLAFGSVVDGTSIQVDTSAESGAAPGAAALTFIVRGVEPAEGLVRLLLERVL